MSTELSGQPLDVLNIHICTALHKTVYKVKLSTAQNHNSNRQGGRESTSLTTSEWSFSVKLPNSSSGMRKSTNTCFLRRWAEPAMDRKRSSIALISFFAPTFLSGRGKSTAVMGAHEWQFMCVHVRISEHVCTVCTVCMRVECRWEDGGRKWGGREKGIRKEGKDRKK